MSVPLGPVAPSSSEASASASTAEGQLRANAQSGASYTAATQIGSMSALKEKAPEVYDKMMKGIAMNVITSMRRSQEHLKETMRQARRDAEG